MMNQSHSILRSQIIRPAVEGLNQKTISLNLGGCEDTVGLWRQRWVEGCRKLEQFAGNSNQLNSVVIQLLSDQEGTLWSPGKLSAEKSVS